MAVSAHLSSKAAAEKDSGGQKLKKFQKKTSVVESVSKYQTQLPEVFCKKNVIDHPKLTGKHLCESLFLNEIAGLSLKLY